MRGDFSEWKNHFKKNKYTLNFVGILQQQGKVLLDRDWNDQSRLNSEWQDVVGGDILGKNIVSVPSDAPGAFKVRSANVSGDKIKIALAPGRAWVSGLLAHLELFDAETESGEGGEGEGPEDGVEELPTMVRVATYIESNNPILPSLPDISTIKEGVRDAVIVESWREEISGFQLPEHLIEPALGGPDTTERVNTGIALKLLRLEKDDNCFNIVKKLKDSPKGKLTVVLETVKDVPNECNCPTIHEGGYTGFEHRLYRIEIAKLNNPKTDQPKFKYSRLNGGLVGRGNFEAASKRIEINSNLQAILTSGLDKFYLEIILYNEELGRWDVIFGDNANLVSDSGEIQLGTAVADPIFGRYSDVPVDTEGNGIFFRLWDDIRNISDFDLSEPAHLQDGIHLKFDPPSASNSNYSSGDFWIFSVRAGGIFNNEILLDKEQSQGIQYYRAPIGILRWNDAKEISSSDNPLTNQIDDCRVIFRPITEMKSLYYISGDGQEGFAGKDLPFPIIVGVANANNTPLSNIPIKFTVTAGNGELRDSNKSSGSSGSGTINGNEIDKTTIKILTDKNGLASCVWMLGDDSVDQQVKAVMLDEKDLSIHLPIFFNAKSEANQGNCTIVLHPGDDIEELIEKTLPPSGGRICFTAGAFNLKNPIIIKDRNNIMIDGTGSATQISVSGSESAFIFSNCTHIHVSNLSVSSVSPTSTVATSSSIRSKPGIKGVLTFMNCSAIKITDCKISCNQRFVHTQACITFSNDEDHPSSQIEVSSCDINIGAMQIGLLAVNTNGILIKDNYFDVVPIADKPVFNIAKTPIMKNNFAYKNLVNSITKVNRTLLIAKEVKNLSNHFTNLVNRSTLLFKSNDKTEAAKTLRESAVVADKMNSYLKQVIGSRHSGLPNTGTEKFSKALDVASQIGVNLRKSTVNVTLPQLENLSASSKEFQNFSLDAFSSITENDKKLADSEVLLRRAMVFSAITALDIDKLPFGEDILARIREIRQDATVAYQGISCAGSLGQNIQIYNNTIKGVVEGIHIGASISDPTKSVANRKTFDEISICSNKIDLKVPKWYLRQKHAIFVGNVWTAYVKDNIVSVNRINNVKIGIRVFSSPITGIQVFGYHGRLIMVSGNTIVHADAGIRFVTLGYLPDNSVKDKPLRAITYNVVQNFVNPIDKSGSFEQSLIKLADNIPGP